jgi:hypothetical protein
MLVQCLALLAVITLRHYRRQTKRAAEHIV